MVRLCGVLIGRLEGGCGIYGAALGGRVGWQVRGFVLNFSLALLVTLLLALDLVVRISGSLLGFVVVCFDVVRYVLFGFYGYFCG